MTTAIIGTGGLGSVIGRQLASGGETLRLSSADTDQVAAWLGAGPPGSARRPRRRPLLHYWLRSVPATRPGALRDLVKEQLRKFPGAAFTPHQIGKVLERSAGEADHGRAMIAGPHRARHPSVGAGRRRLGRPVLPRREAFPANGCLPALDARPPERPDHIVGG